MKKAYTKHEAMRHTQKIALQVELQNILDE